MTKMAATPIYGKNPSKIFSGTSQPISRNRELPLIIVCSNDEPGLTMTYFTARSNCVRGFGFSVDKNENSGFV